MYGIISYQFRGIPFMKKYNHDQNYDETDDFLELTAKQTCALKSTAMFALYKVLENIASL